MIILKSQDESERMVQEGVPYRLLPGEYIFGSTANYEQVTLEHELAKEGIQWGNLIAKGTKFFGIKACSQCEQRRQILNKINALGLKEAVRQIKETLSEE